MDDDPPRGSEVPELLRRWHGGDKTALHALLERHLPAIRAQVHHRLGPVLLQPDDRDVIVLHRFDGLPFAGVGAQLGISPTLPRCVTTGRSPASP